MFQIKTDADKPKLGSPPPGGFGKNLVVSNIKKEAEEAAQEQK